VLSEGTNKQRADTAADAPGNYRGCDGHSQRAAGCCGCADRNEAADQHQSRDQTGRALGSLVPVGVVPRRQVGLVLELAHVADPASELGFCRATVCE
jgi:hypothetical protein